MDNNEKNKPINTYARWAYTLGLCTFITYSVGAILAPLAIYFGIQGLKQFKNYPHKADREHSWTGIVAGSISLIGIILFLILHFKIM